MVGRLWRTVRRKWRVECVDTTGGSGSDALQTEHLEVMLEQLTCVLSIHITIVQLFREVDIWGTVHLNVN